MTFMFAILWGLRLKYCDHYKEDIEVLEDVQRTAMELVKGLEHESYEKSVWGNWFV